MGRRRRREISLQDTVRGDASKKNNTGFPLWHCVNAPSAAHTKCEMHQKNSLPSRPWIVHLSVCISLSPFLMRHSPHRRCRFVVYLAFLYTPARYGLLCARATSSLSHSILSNSVKRFHLLLQLMPLSCSVFIFHPARDRHRYSVSPSFYYLRYISLASLRKFRCPKAF